MKRAAGYIPGGSSGSAREEIERYCLENDYLLEWLDGDVGIGEVVFGRWLNGRRIDAVIVADSSDVSDDFYRYLAYKCVLCRRHSDLIAVNSRFGKHFAMQMAVIESFIGKLCEVELENQPLQRVNDRTDKAARGQYIGGRAPIGYRVSDGRLEINPEEVPIVLMVIDRKRTGKTMLSTVDALNQNGYKTRNGKPFVISTVQSVWNNEMFYKGYRRSGDSWVKGQHEAILKD